MVWVIDEALKLPKQADRPILFETGYGPSGLPHIGTFTEVARTTWVRRAYEQLHGAPTKLLAFSDDMDALRRVPDNVPNKEMLEQHLGLPLSQIPDPFDTHSSFAEHNNAKLREFLDRFEFEYEFASSTDYYRTGKFDAALSRVIQCHDEIVDVIRPTLGEERGSHYSPLMPIHPRTGQVMQVEIKYVDSTTGQILWVDPDGERWATSAYGGACKLQWKADWALRWYALGIDYEMSGKDLIESVKLSSQICRILGKEPPISLTYELFLDEHGHKISKSKGNGLSIEDWLRYGPAESLAHFVFANPQRAKKIYLGMIPRATDEYIDNRAKLTSQTPAEWRENSAWYVDRFTLPQASVPFSFGLLINLASVLNAEDPATIWTYLYQRAPADREQWDDKLLSTMIDNVIAYYRDMVKPNKVYRAPTEIECTALLALITRLRTLAVDADAVTIQTDVYAVGNEYFKPLKGWFDCLYQVLLGQTEGPRFGMFVALYGIEKTIQLIEDKMNS